MIMKWMEVYIVARTGRPKSDNPKKQDRKNIRSPDTYTRGNVL